MDAIEALILGLAQGLTEFFPVSSSGHLAMLQALFGGREPGGLLFEVAVHVATLFAIAVFYRKRILALVLGTLGRDPETLEYVAKLAVATRATITTAQISSLIGKGRFGFFQAGGGAAGWVVLPEA